MNRLEPILPSLRFFCLAAVATAVACGGESTTDPVQPPPEEPGVRIGATGGVATFEGGSVVLTIPAGALTGDVSITAEAIAAPRDSAYLIKGTAYEFGPDGTRFDPPARLELSFDPGALPEDATVESITLGRYNGTEWEAAAENVTADLATGRISGDISSFSIWSIFDRPCDPVYFTATQLSSSLSNEDCVGRETGASRWTDYRTPERSSSGLLRFTTQSTQFSPHMGLTINGAFYAVATGETTARFTIGFPTGVAPKLWVASQESLGEGPYAYTLEKLGLSGMPSPDCGDAVFLVPGFVGSSTLNSSDCSITIEQSPDPDAIGKQVYEERYHIKILAGQTITINVTRNGGEEEFSPFPTLYTPGTWTQPDSLANDYTLTWTAPSTDFYTLGVSGTLKYDESIDDLVAATGGYRINIR